MFEREFLQALLVNINIWNKKEDFIFSPYDFRDRIDQ